MALKYQEDLECDLAADIRNIAEASPILQQKGVELCVQLQPSSAEFAVPPPDVLTQLARVIQRIKCYKLKTARCPSEDFHRAYCFSASHISALSDARTSLQELCMSDHDVGTLNDIISDASMASIGTFSSLTRLDLVCYGCPALDSLGQLSHLQKLALHLRLKTLRAHGSAREPCCEAVLLNNNAGLKKVQLDGYAWSDATYLALLTLTSLKVLALNVATISSLSAHVLGNVVATRCISIWFRNSFSIAGSALQGLTSSCANITSLRLDYMPLDKFQHLCTMEYLSSLVIVNSGSFTGSELVTQPNVCHLDLVSCCDLDTEGLRHIVCVFSNLTSIGMVKDSQGRWPRVRIDSFVEISQLRKLELVDLSGLASITADQAQVLEHAIRGQQELGLLQRDVRLRLPRIPYDGTCTQLWINSSHQHFFGGIEPGEQLDVALERYCHQQQAIAGAKLMLRCCITATVIKGASRFAAAVSRLL